MRRQGRQERGRLIQVARRHGYADLAAVGMQLRERAPIAQGKIDQGLALLYEAMACVLAGELTPVHRLGLLLGNHGVQGTGGPAARHKVDRGRRGVVPGAAGDHALPAGLGGDVNGDLVSVPASQLAVFPGTTHFFGLAKTELVLGAVLSFLDAPLPEGRPRWVR